MLARFKLSIIETLISQEGKRVENNKKNRENI